MTEPAKKPVRKRFQFSLRTLLIVVLSFAGSWFLTIKWGANQIAREHVEKMLKNNDLIKEAVITELGDGIIQLEYQFLFYDNEYDMRKRTKDDYIQLKIVVNERVPFPFIVTSSAELITGENLLGGEDGSIFIWFFGAKYQLTEPHQRPRKK